MHTAVCVPGLVALARYFWKEFFCVHVSIKFPLSLENCRILDLLYTMCSDLYVKPSVLLA